MRRPDFFPLLFVDAIMQGRTRSSSVFYSIRSTLCHTKWWTLLSSTSFVFQILTRRGLENRTNYRCSGIRACSSSARGDFQRALHSLFYSSYSFRYASDLTPDQKDALLDVVRANPHPQMGPEIRTELVNSVERGAPRPDADGDIEMD